MVHTAASLTLSAYTLTSVTRSAYTLTSYTFTSLTLIASAKALFSLQNLKVGQELCIAQG